MPYGCSVAWVCEAVVLLWRECILHLIFTNIYDTQMATANCVHPQAQHEKPGAHCEQWHGHHKSTLTCTMRSSEHAAHRLFDAQCSHIALVAQGLALCVIPYHPCMRICVLSLEWSLLTRLSTSSSSSSSSSTWCSSRRLMRSPLKIPCATPAWGAWSLWNMSHPSQVMSPRRWSSQTLMSTSDIYFQNALDDTASFPNNPDVDDNELAEFLAVVVDRTGQPVEVRSNNDQFSCDIRNLKSAQSQFPLVTPPKRMICQTGGSVQERIAEERESSNAQIRTMLNEQRRTIIAEYGEKVLHHELLAAQVEQDRKVLHEELLRQQQEFREVHQQDLMKQKEL